MMQDNRMQEFVQYSELKQLAYTIGVMQQEKPFQSLAALSFLPGEGKTLLCAALATAYAEIYHVKVLVVNTASFQGKRSLALKDHINESTPLLETISLDELRTASNGDGIGPGSSTEIGAGGEIIMEAKIVSRESIPVPMKGEDDFSLIKRVAENRSNHYGLILFDTAPIQAKNRRTMDPLMVARLCGASVLVVSREFLDGPNVSTALKVLKDPSLHLIGLVSSEDHHS